MQGPKSAVFTTVRARNGHLFYLDKHLAKLKQHGEILGISIPEIIIPEGLEECWLAETDRMGLRSLEPLLIGWEPKDWLVEQIAKKSPCNHQLNLFN